MIRMWWRGLVQIGQMGIYPICHLFTLPGPSASARVNSSNRAQTPRAILRKP